MDERYTFLVIEGVPLTSNYGYKRALGVYSSDGNNHQEAMIVLKESTRWGRLPVISVANHGCVLVVGSKGEIYILSWTSDHSSF